MLSAPNPQHKPPPRSPHGHAKADGPHGANVAALVARLRETFEGGVMRSACQALEESRTDPYGFYTAEKPEAGKASSLTQSLAEFDALCDKLYEAVSAARQVVLNRLNDNHNLGQGLNLMPLPSKDQAMEPTIKPPSSGPMTVDAAYARYTSMAAGQLHSATTAQHILRQFSGYTELDMESPRPTEEATWANADGGDCDQQAEQQNINNDVFEASFVGGGDYNGMALDNEAGTNMEDHEAKY